MKIVEFAKQKLKERSKDQAIKAMQNGDIKIEECLEQFEKEDILGWFKFDEIYDYVEKNCPYD